MVRNLRDLLGYTHSADAEENTKSITVQHMPLLLDCPRGAVEPAAFACKTAPAASACAHSLRACMPSPVC